MSSSQETTFSLLIAALGKAAGVEGIAPGEGGVCRMEVGERPLSIIRQGDSALLYTALGALPGDDAAAARVRAELLSANVLYRGTYGACLGVAPEDGMITVCYQTPMHSVTGEGFALLVENFINLADMWEKRLAGIAAGEERPAPVDGQNAPGLPLMNDPLMRA